MLSIPPVYPLLSLAALVGTKLGSKMIFVAADVNAFMSMYDLGRAEEQVGRPAEDKGECCVDALQDGQEVRGAGGGAGWGEGGAGAVDLGAEGAARGGEAGDEEAVFGVRHAAAEDPGQRADIEAFERTGGAAAGEGQDHPDAGEEDSADEREAHRRGEGAAGAFGCDEGEGRIY
ncbi:uncharacterized protein MONOS_8974 [Monocercomonoides exilis]|uniref:uncharacterized protein n=1 Tax=Monocercomonoides exilis TaxID=2049356 RepID=UPI00355A2F63|nr:hypothetical protein MONOS_8974 [Monocercomonoides exilis]|eukprot:MONOS_8974.1-p1 / transcript=MONOS_8974.1 / gene=MONOS_8974 / organism=Monocercomonoides_exilis_PA203 / gene_product=unspecified product / transcript_product=unspecified product / location=Mono_scaffold00354:42321-42948(+) / protein_length=175 / sequence_SO=supercontig / SO=protein_coding / is_pseudo=false